VLGIDQMNYAVKGGRLTPALVSPVATAVGKHAGEVAHRCHARSGKRCASVRVSPGITAVSGLVDMVGIVVRETTAAFVHTRNVYSPVARHVAGDLHVADEGAGVAHCYRAMPRDAVVTGEGGHERAGSHVKVVPGNVHSPEERRTGIVIGPA